MQGWRTLGVQVIMVILAWLNSHYEWITLSNDQQLAIALTIIGGLNSWLRVITKGPVGQKMKLATTAAGILFLLCLVGCKTQQIVIQPPDESQPTVEIQTNGFGAVCSWSTFTQGADGDTSVDVVVAQDGKSDWSVSRLLGWLGDIAGSLPIIGGNGTRQMSSMQGPSPGAVCAQLVNQNKEPEPAPPEESTNEEAVTP